MIIINRDEFKKCIKALENNYNFTNQLNELARKFGAGFYVEYVTPDCSESLIWALSDIFCDKYDTIPWYCYEINFGKDYREGDNTYDGKEYPLRDPDELYDYLVMMRDVQDN